MDGLYSGKLKSEIVAQAQLSRHRLLTFNTSPAGLLNDRDASSYGSLDPNNVLALIPPTSQEGGPHFHMSPETPDGRPTLGFEFALLDNGMLGPGDIATPAPGGFQVTVWVMISATELSDGSLVPAWAALAPQSGVAFRTLYHSFDVNATLLRFQIGNIVQQGSITVAFCEL